MATYDIIALKETITDVSGQLLVPTTTDTGRVIGNMLVKDITIDSGSITASGGSISFGNENLSTTGTLSCGALTPSSIVGFVIGTDVQAHDAGLTSIADLTTAADKGIYTTASDTYSTFDLTSFARTLLDDADAATAATTLGLGTGDSPQFTSVELGDASDTTLARVSAGVASIEGSTISMLGTAQEYTRTHNFNATTLTSTTNSVAWDAEQNQVTTHTLTENTTFAAPTNLADGAYYGLAIIQDASASGFTVAFNSVFKFKSGTAPTLTTTASARDEFVFRSDGTNMYEIGRNTDIS